MLPVPPRQHRVTAIPAYGTAPARTITTTYAVAGDPLTVSVTDPAGTITTRADLLGRTVSYTDTTGATTTTGYDLPGRVTTQTTTGPGGGTSTLAYTYLPDGRVETIKLDAVTVATPAYDANAETTGVSYGNGVTLGALNRRPDGQLLAQTFTLPGNRTLSDTLTRSQTGRITRAVAAVDGATSTDWAYGYDTAARLTTATLAAAGPRPQVALGYGYAATGGCGADPGAGKNGSRSSWTSQTGTGPVQTSTACTDNASRLTSTTGPEPIVAGQAVYDGHGNATQLGTQTFTYDGADRVTATTATTIPGTQTLTYTRDTTNRVVARTATTTITSGGETGTTRYAFTDGSDSPDFQLTPTGALAERYLPLPGGILLTENYAGTGTDTWAIPNLHGDTTATTSSTGAATLTGALYDPYGQPLNTTSTTVDPTATPTTRTGTGTTDAWLGQYQRGYEHTGGLNQTLMGARTYLPNLGIFTTTDPIEGGNTTTYNYPTDPINGYDLTGNCWSWLQSACDVASNTWSKVTSSDTWNTGIDVAKRAWDNPLVRGAVVGIATAAVCSTGIGCFVIAGALIGAAAGASNWAINHRNESLLQHTVLGGISGAWVGSRGVWLARDLVRRGMSSSPRPSLGNMVRYVGKHEGRAWVSPLHYWAKRWHFRGRWR